MATGAGREPARRVAATIESRSETFSFRRRDGFVRKACVVEADREAFCRIQLSCNPAHLRMIAPPIGVGFELPLQISGIEPRKPRRAGSVALASQSMTGEAGVRRARTRTAHRYEPPILAEAIERGRIRGGAAEQRRSRRQAKKVGASQHRFMPTTRRNTGFRCLLLSLAVAACKPPPEDRQSMPTADPQKGLRAIERVGCGSCHSIPGVDWPQGSAGPALDGLAARALIAGRLPNRPDVLAAYIRNAPALIPGSGMPAMPVSQDEARDIAAYLYEKGQP